LALEEHDREDLLRDGRAMPLRGECTLSGRQVVIGFRDAGQLSLYCGPDPVFQFNADRQLRRAFFEGRKFAADHGQLVELVRETRGGKVEFLKLSVDASTNSSVLQSLNDWLRKIDNAALWDAFSWRVPGGGDTDLFRERLVEWLEQIPTVPEIADTPNV
jgi:hypothetical protein